MQSKSPLFRIKHRVWTLRKCPFREQCLLSGWGFRIGIRVLSFGIFGFRNGHFRRVSDSLTQLLLTSHLTANRQWNGVLICQVICAACIYNITLFYPIQESASSPHMAIELPK